MRRLTYAAAISLGGLIDEYEAACVCGPYAERRVLVALSDNRDDASCSWIPPDWTLRFWKRATSRSSTDVSNKVLLGGSGETTSETKLSGACGYPERLRRK
jgi:hypothetical protein